MAVGIFSVAMIFIAGVFPVAIHFTTIASEQTIAAVVADEAFAKIRLYGVNLTPSVWVGSPTFCIDFNSVPNLPVNIREYAYPSDPVMAFEQKQYYYWSAICRPVGGSDVQVTVFISRKIGTGTSYRDPCDVFNKVIYYPKPVPVPVQFGGKTDELVISQNVPPSDATSFINNGSTIVDDTTGHIYRVLERYSNSPDVILLDRYWDAGSPNPTAVWVIPPPINGGRYPCVGVFQKIIRF